jgi:hypothetical protein
LSGAGHLGLGSGNGGVGQLGGGYKQGQFTSNLREGRAVLITSGGSQVSGRGYKGELARGTRGARGAKGNAPCKYVKVMCASE